MSPRRVAGLLFAAGGALLVAAAIVFLASIAGLRPAIAAPGSPPTIGQHHRPALPWAAVAKCPDGRIGPNYFLANSPALGDTHRAAPPLLTGHIHNNPVYTLAAVKKFWAYACRDKANAAQFAADFRVRGFNDPLQLFTQRQHRKALQGIRTAVDWWGGAHPPSLVFRDFKGYYTDYMIPNRPHGAPRVGYTRYTDGPGWFLHVYALNLHRYVDVHILCDQFTAPLQLVPHSYLAATAAFPGKAMPMHTRGG
jgi:hypothetical protein